MAQPDPLKPIVALCKRRGIIYPGSEIYGGFANTYSFGPYGSELKKNIKDFFWKTFVQKRENMVGIDGPILLHPCAWKASGHLDSFNDALIDCKSCKSRFRVDHLLEEHLNRDLEGLSLTELALLIDFHKITCSKCGSKDFTPPRHFNLMFSTRMGKTQSTDDVAYLRPETAQAIFLEYKNIIDTTRLKIPFGIAQIGKAFRNEITPGNFVFRTIEFEQMEIEYFIEEADWKTDFDAWLKDMQKWCDSIGLNPNKLHLKEHDEKKLSHYSKRTVDIVYDFPFGTSELYGLAYRTDFDLKQHAEHAKVNMEYFDAVNNRRFIPHVIEPTFGVDRTILALLCDAYAEEELENGEKRTVLRFAPKIAPIKAAIFPLMKKEPLIKMAREIFAALCEHIRVEYDESGAIGKRYRRQDEIGTPYCVTIDFESLEGQGVTVRERDSMKQERIALASLKDFILDRCH